MPQPVVHFEIHGADAAALHRFYAELFEWSINADNPMNYGVVEPAEGGIGGGITASPMAPEVVIYVQVADPQAYLDRVESLGGTTLMPVTEIPDLVTFAQFRDPAGNVMGLVKG